ncbi:single-stranded DNA-binding protein [Treponema pectinovorum]|uniref:single-stranded DNA-binding protein n=1 Tax=Treponema pectinovorum TaxID=164 RepID=UPI001659FF20|nr:single-stranded DNA-binding protein [Treponema pectinovorum]
MTDLNSITLGGRLTKDAVIEKTKDGLSMCRISMAVNRSKKKKDSEEYEDKPVFVDLAPIYGNYAEAMAKHLTKGTYITVEGYLDMDAWTDSEGKNHQRLKVVPKQGFINPWVERKPKAAEAQTVEATSMQLPESTENMIY